MALHQIYDYLCIFGNVVHTKHLSSRFYLVTLLYTTCIQVDNKWTLFCVIKKKQIALFSNVDQLNLATRHNK